MTQGKTLLLLGLVIAFSLLSFGCVQTGTGTASDTIARVSYEGFPWKTWVIQLTNDHPTTDNLMQYGVKDPTVIKALQNYESSGQKVKIYFTQDLAVWPWEYSDPEVIYCVQPANWSDGPGTCR